MLNMLVGVTKVVIFTVVEVSIAGIDLRSVVSVIMVPTKVDSVVAPTEERIWIPEDPAYSAPKRIELFLSFLKDVDHSYFMFRTTR